MNQRNYGSAELLGNQWVVKAVPHVMTRLKRHFGRARAGDLESVKLNATEEVAEDLLWFSQRFPLTFKPRNALLRAARSGRDRRERLENLFKKTSFAEVTHLAEPARAYQLFAAEFWRQAKRYLLADQMGLGKTLSGIINLGLPEMRPAVIVTLPNLVIQTEKEIRRFLPGLTTHIAKVGTHYPFIKPKPGKDGQPDTPGEELPDVLIVSYTKLHGWTSWLAGKVRSMIADEAQELRRPDSDKYRAAKFLADSCEYVIGMSGTPVYGMGVEIWHVLNVIAPGRLGTLEEFRRDWTGGTDRVLEPEALGSYLRDQHLMLRRTRKDVGRELPPLTRIPITINADPDAFKKVESRAIELAKIIVQRNVSISQRMNAGDQLDSILRQATGVAKAPYVAEFVRMLVDNGESVMLFGWHHAVYEIYRELLADIEPVFLTGKESPAAKEAAKQAFIERKSKVAIISLRASPGLDGFQQACHTLVFGEFDWAHGIHEQCETRVERDGQQEATTAYYLGADDGCDPLMLDVLGVKEDQLLGIRDGGDRRNVLSSRSGGTARMLAERLLARHGISVPSNEDQALTEAA